MKPGRVLIAEDHDSARRILAALLREEGYEVAEAADGEEALARLAGFSPDVVLSDLQMPRLDGMGLLRASMAHSPRPTFVMMAAQLPWEVENEARAQGCQFVFRKPVDVETILATLRTAPRQL
jgi:CheY-like chemotaxis protein